MLPVFAKPSDRYAVVLNGNAGRVTPTVRRAMSEVVPRERLFFTESPEHAREVLHRCVEDELDTVFAGGGDGTIVDTINTLEGFRGQAQQLPAVGVLRLGTGNALARWLGSRGPVADLRRWQQRKVHRYVSVNMVEAEGQLFPFAGLGHDAAVLNDYVWLKSKGKGTRWEALSKGLPGYVVAGLLRTFPNYLRRPNPTVTVTNLGAPAVRVGPDGERVGEPVPTGGVIYRGPAALIGAATTPLYGYGMRMFPHATRDAGRFQLRVLNMSALECVLNFLPVFHGRCEHPGIYDYMTDRVRVQFEDALPYQLGGDARGYRKELTLSIARFPVTMVGQA